MSNARTPSAICHTSARCHMLKRQMLKRQMLKRQMLTCQLLKCQMPSADTNTNVQMLLLHGCKRAWQCCNKPAPIAKPIRCQSQCQGQSPKSFAGMSITPIHTNVHLSLSGLSISHNVRPRLRRPMLRVPVPRTLAT